jgi:hypothetical protein
MTGGHIGGTQGRSMLPEFGRRASPLCSPGRIDLVFGRTTAVHAASGFGSEPPGIGACRLSKAVTDEATFADPAGWRIWHFG